MTDVFSEKKRSDIMSRIGQKDTKPEIIVRRLLHKMGYRFRLHRKDLPGTPDIVLPKYHKVVFVHGCFWHGHEGCRRAHLPETNREFWEVKINKNRDRDAKVMESLQSMGWGCLVVWQCQIKNREELEVALENFLPRIAGK